MNIEIKDLYKCRYFIPEIAAMHQAKYPDYPIQDRDAMYQSRCNKSKLPKTFVAVADGKPVGMISIIRDKHNIVRISSLLVHEDYRQRGIGRSLVKRCIEYAGDAALSQLNLHTVSAVDYYRKLGWVQVGQHVEKQTTKFVMAINVSMA